jgi:hypothetical protein
MLITINSENSTFYRNSYRVKTALAQGTGYVGNFTSFTIGGNTMQFYTKDVRIYNRMLSYPEIRYLYKKGPSWDPV